MGNYNSHDDPNDNKKSSQQNQNKNKLEYNNNSNQNKNKLEYNNNSNQNKGKYNDYSNQNRNKLEYNNNSNRNKGEYNNNQYQNKGEYNNHQYQNKGEYNNHQYQNKGEYNNHQYQNKGEYNNHQNQNKGTYNGTMNNHESNDIKYDVGYNINRPSKGTRPYPQDKQNDELQICLAKAKINDSRSLECMNLIKEQKSQLQVCNNDKQNLIKEHKSQLQVCNNDKLSLQIRLDNYKPNDDKIILNSESKGDLLCGYIDKYNNFERTTCQIIDPRVRINPNSWNELKINVNSPQSCVDTSALMATISPPPPQPLNDFKLIRDFKFIPENRGKDNRNVVWRQVQCTQINKPSLIGGPTRPTIGRYDDFKIPPPGTMPSPDFRNNKRDLGFKSNSGNNRQDLGFKSNSGNNRQDLGFKLTSGNSKQNNRQNLGLKPAVGRK
jgi:hypothetical protein